MRDKQPAEFKFWDVYKAAIKGAPVACALALFCCVTASHGDTPPAAPAATAPAAPADPIAPKKAEEQAPLAVSAAASYPFLRTGDLAPNWSFVTPDGKRLNSRFFLGQSAQLLLVEAAQPTAAQLAAALPLAEKPVTDEIAKLWKEGVAVVAASSDAAAVSGLDEKTGVLKLHDGGGMLGVMLGENTLVGIDRSGFIREMTPFEELPVNDPAQLAAALAQRRYVTPKLEIGAPAPDFSMPDMNGRVRHLLELRGRKNLLLTFFPKCFTGGCANHLTSLQESLPAFIGNDTEIWAVSVDPAEGEKGQIAFAKNLGVQFPLIPDEGRNLCFLYEAASSATERAARMSVLIDKSGIVRAIDRTVRVASHGPDMLGQMEALKLLKN